MQWIMASMTMTKRIYNRILAGHLGSLRQMAMISGPRQVGKTTSCRKLADFYLNWDNGDDHAVILKGPAAVAEKAGIHKPLLPIVF
jgi:uncharacterized protein